MTETITIPRAEYDRLRAAAETLEDAAAFEAAMTALARGEEEMIPAAYANRIIDGESPVRVWRELRGLSGAELARRSGVNPVQLHDIESGRKTGSVATLRKLAEALGVALDDVAG